MNPHSLVLTEEAACILRGDDWRNEFCKTLSATIIAIKHKEELLNLTWSICKDFVERLIALLFLLDMTNQPLQRVQNFFYPKTKSDYLSLRGK